MSSLILEILFTFAFYAVNDGYEIQIDIVPSEVTYYLSRINVFEKDVCIGFTHTEIGPGVYILSKT